MSLSLSHVLLAALLLVVSSCLLLPAMSADPTTCSFTVYSDSMCAGRPAGATTTVSGLTQQSQCVPSLDGVTSQGISYFGPSPGWNITYSYYQTSNNCAAASAYRFHPNEAVSDCYQIWLNIAEGQIQLTAYLAANCTTQTQATHKQHNEDGNSNSIMSLLGGRL